MVAARPGSAVNRGSSDSATFMRKVPEPQRQLLHAARGNPPAAPPLGTSARIQQLRIDVGGDRVGAHRLAGVEDDAGGAAAVDDHLAHRGVGLDLDACARAPPSPWPG